MKHTTSRIRVFFLAAAMSAMMAFSSFAAETVMFTDDVPDISWITQGSKNGTDIFSNITSNVQDAGRSLYTLMTVIGAVVAIVALLLNVYRMQFGDPQKRNQAKDGIFYVLFGAMIAGGAVSIISVFLSIGSNAFG